MEAFNNQSCIVAQPEEDYISYNTHILSYTIAFVLSCVGIFYIIFTLVVLKLYQNTLSRMVFFISFCDLGINVSVIALYSLNASELSAIKCQIFVGIAHYLVLVSFSWATCFTHAFYKVVKERTDTLVAANMIYYILISFIVPIPLAVLAIMWGFVEYDNEEQAFCYHKLVYGTLDKSFFYTENLPFAVAVLFSFYYCIASIRMMHNMGELGGRWRVLYILQFPCILIVCWLGQQLNVVCAQLGIHLEYGKQISTIFQTLIYMQGFINAIAYGVSYRVVSGYKELFKKYCRRRNKQRNSQNSDNNVNASAISDHQQLEDELLERAMKKQSIRSLAAAEGSTIIMSSPQSYYSSKK